MENIRLIQTILRLGAIKKSIDLAFEELTTATLSHDEIMQRWETKLTALE